MGSRSSHDRDRDRDRGGGSDRRGPARRHADARWSNRRVAVQTRFALAEVIPEPGRPWRRLLRLDGEDCSHVDLRDATRIEFAYVRRFADVVDLLAPPGAAIDALHLGGGGFTLPRYVAATRPGSRSEVAELDRELVALAQAELGLQTGRALRVRAYDAREVLERRASDSADIVVLDAFLGTLVPRHLRTTEFLAEAARALRPSGVFVANVIDAPPPLAARALVAGALGVFPHAALIATRKVVRGRQGGNLVVVASPTPLRLTDLRRRALAGPVPELVVGGAELTAWAGNARPEHDAPAR
jgi:spermidine synthase